MNRESPPEGETRSGIHPPDDAPSSLTNPEATPMDEAGPQPRNPTLSPATARHPRPVRRIAVPLTALVGLIIFAAAVHPHIALSTWLCWRYLKYWALVLLWSAACLSGGDAVVRRLTTSLPLSERLLFAFAAGLLLFVTATFVAGILHLLSSAFFVALPCLLLLAGGRPFLRLAKRVARRRPLLLPKQSAESWAVTLFGVGALALVYFNVLSPQNATADALWYHLTIPERYAVEGGISRYPEGWYMGTLPQLASLVYTWAFLLPKGGIFDRVVLAAHLEFCIFLWTLFGIPVLVRWVLGPARSRGEPRVSTAGTWAALFLFPGIFLYDSSLGIAADHVLAFWAVPILLALRRLWSSYSPRHAVLFAIPVAGALLTKYQAAAVVALPLVAFAARGAWLALGPRRSRAFRLQIVSTVLTCLGAGLCLTAPHWLKNWLWYGDPFYPNLYRHLTLSPWSSHAQHLYENWFLPVQMWRPSGTTAEKLLATVKVLFTFSFIPHDYAAFHGKVPVFGSLFTLLLLPLVFLPRARRIWVVAAAALCGVTVWFWMSHVDRYLQALTPWMAVVVAAVIARMWAGGRLDRAAASLLVAFQVVWGAGIPFFPTYGIHSVFAAQKTIDLLAANRVGDTDKLKNPFAGRRIARLLPPDATVLVHDMNGALGIGRPTVSDVGPFQAFFDYGRIPSPRRFQETLRGLGVTHLYWRGDTVNGLDTLAGDLAFLSFATFYVGEKQSVDLEYVAPLLDRAPPDHRWLEWPVAVFSCTEGYSPGLYQLGDLTVPIAAPRQFPAPRTPASDENARALLDSSRIVVREGTCAVSVAPTPEAGFTQVSVRLGAEIWLKTTPPPLR